MAVLRLTIWTLLSLIPEICGHHTFGVRFSIWNPLFCVVRRNDDHFFLKSQRDEVKKDTRNFNARQKRFPEFLLSHRHCYAFNMLAYWFMYSQVLANDLMILLLKHILPNEWPNDRTNERTNEKMKRKINRKSWKSEKLYKWNAKMPKIKWNKMRQCVVTNGNNKNNMFKKKKKKT